MLCVALGACQGAVLEVGDDDPPPVAVPRDLVTRCRPPPPNARTFDSVDAMKTALVGRWFRCHGVGAGILYPPAIELAAADRWFSLIDDGSGALVRGKDDALHGTWGLEPPLTLNIAFANRARQTLVVLFDPDGRHLSVARSTFESVDVRYVRE